MLNAEEIKNVLIKKDGTLRKSAPKYETHPDANRVFYALKGLTSFSMSGLFSSREHEDLAKQIGIEVGILSPEGEAGTKIRLNGDNVEVKHYGWPGSGSLLEISASRTAKIVNSLDILTLAACYIASKKAPYSSNKKEVIETIKGSKEVAETASKIKLGSLRLELVKINGDSFGSPLDNYLTNSSINEGK